MTRVGMSPTPADLQKLLRNAATAGGARLSATRPSLAPSVHARTQPPSLLPPRPPPRTRPACAAASSCLLCKHACNTFFTDARVLPTPQVGGLDPLQMEAQAAAASARPRTSWSLQCPRASRHI